MLAFCSFIYAANFTPGNLVVVRIGDGSASLSNASSAVFLDEYTPAGTLVQSVAIPTAASGNNHSLTLSGSATSEGALTLSVNGQLLVLAGYDAGTGKTSVATDSTINRTIGTVSSNGTINTATGFLAGSAYKKNNFRGAATQDGSAFWSSGAGSSGTGGTWYVTSGSFTSSATQISSTISSTRVVNIFGGQLYTSSSSSSYHGVNSVGSGLPTSTGQTSANLPGFPAADTSSSAYGFYFFDLNPNVPGVDVAYVCDDRAASGGGLLKYSLVSGSWVLNGNISSSAGLRGVTGYSSCSGVKLFISGQGGLYTFTDASGYNQPLTGSLTQLVTPATNTVIRGVAFAPGTTAQTALQVTATGVNITCNGAANGSISTAPTGGTGPYTFNWGNSITTQNRNNLAPGSYTVTVTDNGGCSATASATITQPTLLSASASSTNITCNGGTNGAVNLSVSGGTSPYTYSWSNGSTGQNLSVLTAGTFTVTVNDNHGCTASASSIITQPAAITITPTVTNLPCTGGANTGAVSVSVAGGTPGYTYLWSSSSSSQNITGLNAGTYTLTVTDNASCTISQSFIVSQSGSLSLTTNVTNVKCNGQANGAITVTATGGTPSYNYTWSTGNNNQPQSGLTAGSYTVTVTDNGGCTLVNSISVTQPAALIANATATEAQCHGNATGSVNLSVSGGTTPYTYQWTNSATTQNLNNIPAASYAVSISDNNNCSVSASVTVNQPDSLAVSGNVTNASSFGGSDGAVALLVTGGTSAYSYAWNSGSGANNTGLVAGNYCVTVTDAHNCSASDCFNVSQPTGINETGFIQNFSAFATGGMLYINAEVKEVVSYNLQLRDLTGRLLVDEVAPAGSNIQLKIPVSYLATGCYIISFVSEQAVFSKKVIITNSKF